MNHTLLNIIFRIISRANQITEFFQIQFRIISNIGI